MTTPYRENQLKKDSFDILDLQKIKQKHTENMAALRLKILKHCESSYTQGDVEKITKDLELTGSCWVEYCKFVQIDWEDYHSDLHQFVSNVIKAWFVEKISSKGFCATPNGKHVYISFPKEE